MKQYRYNGVALHRIAERLAELREARGLLQKEVARETGLNIGLIETGRRNITLNTLERLCRYYDIPPAEFFRGLGL